MNYTPRFTFKLYIFAFKGILITHLLILVMGCQNQNELPQDIRLGLIKDNKITVDGQERDYDLYLPDNQLNSSVVILLHGNSSNSDDITGESGTKAPYRLWLSTARLNNIILIIPNGAIGNNGNQGWNDCRADGTGNPTTNDVLFIQSILNEVKQKYTVNESKVFVHGSSNGGHMAIRLAQEIPKQITAIAVMIAAMPASSACTDATEPVSVLFMNGTADPILPYNGGAMASNRGTVLSTKASVDYWINRNQTSTNPVTTNLPEINPLDNSTIVRSVYGGGTNNTEVVLYQINGGGHTEPSKLERYSEAFKLIVGAQSGDVEMVEEVWDFFKDKEK